MPLGTLLFLFMLLLGAVQGIVMGALLIRGSGADTQRLANRFLAALLFFLAYRLLVTFLKVQGLAGVDHWLYHLLIEFNWIYGPLLYFYAMGLIRQDFSLRRSSLWHFAPVVVEFLFSNFIKSQNFYWDGSRESLSWAGYYGYILWVQTPFPYVVAMGLILIYGTIAWRQLARQQSEGNDYRLKPDFASRLRKILLCALGFALVFLALAIVDYLYLDYAFDPVYQVPGFVMFALLTYALGLQAIWHRQEIQWVRVEAVPVIDPALLRLAQGLQRSMTEGKLFLRPELTVAQLAEAVDAKPFMVSRALNQVLGQSFPDFVNGYRMEEWKRRLQQPDADQFTLLAHAFESGFNSKASFNRVVRNRSGLSPREWQARLAK